MNMSDEAKELTLEEIDKLPLEQRAAEFTKIENRIRKKLDAANS